MKVQICFIENLIFTTLLFLLPLDGVILIDPEALQGRKGLYKTPELILLDSFFCIYVHGHSHTGLKELHLDSLF